MSTPLNRELREYKFRIAQYRKVLKIDTEIKSGELENPDGRPLLSDDEITDINYKINELESKLESLLDKDSDYSEILE